MKRTIAVLLAATLLITIGCKPKTEKQNENITFAATITGIDEDGTMVETSADVGFTTALVHLAEGYTPDFTLKIGQTVQLTILPMMTKSIPPQVTAVSVTLLVEAPDNGVASVTDGLDPMPMLTPGADAVTDAETPDTLEARMADMLPILDAITRTMGIEGEQKFMPADPLFVWHVLAEMSEDWGHTVMGITVDGDTIRVPEDSMRMFALAAFNRAEALPPLPEELSERVSYDEAFSAYRITKLGLDNTSTTSIDTFSDNGDGTYTATLGFYTSSGERLGGVLFTLQDAPTDSGVYRFTVTDATAVKA